VQLHTADRTGVKHKQLQLFVEFLGWFEDPEFVYLAMEYLPLGDLSNFNTGEISEIDSKCICR
jgi:calcium/calmodulin-dependent protein kinase I